MTTNTSSSSRLTTTNVEATINMPCVFNPNDVPPTYSNPQKHNVNPSQQKMSIFLNNNANPSQHNINLPASNVHLQHQHMLSQQQNQPPQQQDVLIEDDSDEEITKEDLLEFTQDPKLQKVMEKIINSDPNTYFLRLAQHGAKLPVEFNVEEIKDPTLIHMDEDTVVREVPKPVVDLKKPPLFLKSKAPTNESSYTQHVDNPLKRNKNLYPTWSNGSQNLGSSKHHPKIKESILHTTCNLQYFSKYMETKRIEKLI